MMAYIAEFIGTFLLILLGDSVVANVTLDKSGMKGEAPSRLRWRGDLPLWFRIYFGAASGAHFNPALTLALAVDGSLAWSMVPGYVLAQFAGAFLGGCVVYEMFKDQLTLPLTQALSSACSAQGQAFRTFPETFSARLWLPLYWYLPSREWEMWRELPMWD